MEYLNGLVGIKISMICCCFNDFLPIFSTFWVITYSRFLSISRDRAITNWKNDCHKMRWQKKFSW